MSWLSTAFLNMVRYCGRLNGDGEEVEWYVGEVVGYREDERNEGEAAELSRGRRGRKEALQARTTDSIQ